MFSEVLNLVLLCHLGSVLEAAPQAQPKATWNAEKAFVQLPVLLGTFLPGTASVHYLCALPVPLSEKVTWLAGCLVDWWIGELFFWWFGGWWVSGVMVGGLRLGN